MRGRTGGFLAATAVLALAWTGTARADGMMWVEKAASGATGEAGKVSPTAQRAVLDRDGSRWNLTIEPKYVRPKAGAAWLVPFPHCPTVTEGDPRVLEELFLVTAPLFVRACNQSCYCDDGSGGGIGCGGASDAGGTDEGRSVVNPGTAPVVVWQTGTVGSLDFVVVSSDEGESVTAWLDQNGYAVAPELEAFVAQNDADYRCWFAARVAAGSGAEEALPPVTFRLDARDPPFYPLRLTRLGVPAGASLELSLIVVDPLDASQGPYQHLWSHRADAPDCLLPPETVYDNPYADDTAPDQAGWAECVAEHAANEPEGRFAVTFNGLLDIRAAAFVGTRYLCDTQFWPLGGGDCLETDRAVAGTPTTWTDTTKRWAQPGTRVTRYEGTLPSLGLASDVTFETLLESPYPDVPAVYARIFTDCGIPCDAICEGRYTPHGPDAGQGDTPSEAGMAGVVLLIGVPLLIAGARRRFR